MSEVRIGHSVAFPSLGNRSLVGAAQANVLADVMFQNLATAVIEADESTVAGAVAPFSTWLMSMIQAANDALFRFDVRELFGPTPPSAWRLEPGGRVESLEVIRARDGRGTAKLVALVGLGGSGEAELTLAGAETRVVLCAGASVVFPAFLLPTITHTSGDHLTGLAVEAHGPAFR